jgi:hypothetical protein
MMLYYPTFTAATSSQQQYLHQQHIKDDVILHNIHNQDELTTADSSTTSHKEDVILHNIHNHTELTTAISATTSQQK